MLMMDPRRPAESGSFESICAPTSRHMVKTVVRLTCRTSSQSADGNLSDGCLRCMPAQLRRMVILWSSARIFGRRPTTDSCDARSAVYIVHLRPSAAIWSCVLLLVVSRCEEVRSWFWYDLYQYGLERGGCLLPLERGLGPYFAQFLLYRP